MNSWYETVNYDEPLMQGDILFRCPVLFPDKEANYAELSDPAEIEIELAEVDVIVMTQSCDLQSCESKKPVILCPLSNLTPIKANSLDNLRKDKITNLHLLNTNTHSTDLPNEYLVIDFSTVYTLPFGLINNWKNNIQGKRPRLIPPYLEHMSQRFAMTFMRVGTDDDSKITLESLKAEKTRLLPQASNQ